MTLVQTQTKQTAQTKADRTQAILGRSIRRSRRVHRSTRRSSLAAY